MAISPLPAPRRSRVSLEEPALASQAPAAGPQSLDRPRNLGGFGGILVRRKPDALTHVDVQRARQCSGHAERRFLRTGDSSARVDGRS